MASQQVAQAACASHYEALGVEPTADRATIKAAFRRVVLQHHPDKRGAGADANADAALQAANAAWLVLQDDERRAAYDASSLASQAVVISATVCVDDMDLDEASNSFTHPCRCGDTYTLACNEDGDCDTPAVLTCPSCSLRVRVVDDEDASDVDDC